MDQGRQIALPNIIINLVFSYKPNQLALSPEEGGSSSQGKFL